MSGSDIDSFKSREAGVIIAGFDWRASGIRVSEADVDKGVLFWIGVLDGVICLGVILAGCAGEDSTLLTRSILKGIKKT